MLQTLAIAVKELNSFTNSEEIIPKIYPYDYRKEEFLMVPLSIVQVTLNVFIWFSFPGIPTMYPTVPNSIITSFGTI